MKKLLFIFLLPLLFCDSINGQSPEESPPVLTLEYIPSHIPFEVAYELRAPFLQIFEDRTIYFNDEGAAREGYLSENELNTFISNLSELGLFELTMDTLHAAALDSFLNEDGSLIKLSYQLDDKRDTLSMGMLDTIPDSLLWKLPSDYKEIPWFHQLQEKIVRVQTYLHTFRPDNHWKFSGPRAAVFLDCENIKFGCTGSLVSAGADSFYLESILKPKDIQSWPLQSLEPVINTARTFEKVKEVKITNTNILKEIDFTGVKSGKVYRYEGKTFAVYFRPLYGNSK